MLWGVYLFSGTSEQVQRSRVILKSRVSRIGTSNQIFFPCQILLMSPMVPVAQAQIPVWLCTYIKVHTCSFFSLFSAAPAKTWCVLSGYIMVPATQAVKIFLSNTYAMAAKWVITSSHTSVEKVLLFSIFPKDMNSNPLSTPSPSIGRPISCLKFLTCA